MVDKGMGYRSMAGRGLVCAATAAGVLVALAAAYVLVASIVDQVLFGETACASDEVTTSAGVTYSLFSPPDNSMGCDLRRRAAGAWGWEVVPGVGVGATYSDLHAGISLKLSNDESLLFVVRNTNDKTEQPIWTDVIDISREPVRTVVQGLNCCMEERSDDPITTDSEGLRRRSEAVWRMAFESGAAR
jgi:hypothetical protein